MVENRIKFVNIPKIMVELRKKLTVQEPYNNRTAYNVRCPFCTDKKYHLGIDFEINGYNCFRCPAKGKLTKLLTKFQIPYKTTEQISIAQLIDTTSFTLFGEKKETNKKINIPINVDWDREAAKDFDNFLESRGLDKNLVTKDFRAYPITDINSMYIDEKSKIDMFGYCIFPINDFAFYARKYMPDEKVWGPKHIIKKSVKKMPLFYFYDKPNSNVVLVVESLFNLIKASMFGYSSVCLFGKSNYQNLVEFLKTRTDTRQICFVFDNDVKIDEVNSFFSRTRKTCEEFDASYVPPSVMPCNDIADMKSKEELDNVLSKSLPISSIFMESMKLKMEAFNV